MSIFLVKLLIFNNIKANQREISLFLSIIVNMKHYKTSFRISKMDCPSEEQMIRMSLHGLKHVLSMEFHIAKRLLHVYHWGSYDKIFERINTLNLDASVIESIESDIQHGHNENNAKQRQVLWIVLIINASFFIIEMLAGLLSKSMGLVADSLDMLADSIVYVLALIAVGGSILLKKKIARFAGYFQILLAVMGFVEVIRRFFDLEKIPDFTTMIVVSILALIANVVCLYILQKNKSHEAHMQASLIFTSNDVIINAGVILAGILVYVFQSSYPDLIVGSLVFAVVLRGAYRILRLAK
jgi:cation transport ATPase